MKQDQILKVFAQLRTALIAVLEQENWIDYSCGLTEEEFNAFKKQINQECLHNPWFTPSHVKSAIRGVIHLLEPDSFERFVYTYAYASQPKRVAVIMAGNIPLVGFHDFMCVLTTGNKPVCKLSSSDSRLLLTIIQWMIAWEPALSEVITVSLGPIKDYQAVIATGSDNTISQFEKYFTQVPHLFRKNRTSIAVLDGTETDDELKSLAQDCFLYFGMGCRNVSKLFIPADFNLNRIFENFLEVSELIQHHKYGNNYDYNRTVYLMNNIPFLDNNVFMLKEDSGLHAPLSVIYYERYENKASVDQFIEDNEAVLQAVVGHAHIPFGKAQNPDITDFADNIDTCKWLNSL